MIKVAIDSGPLTSGHKVRGIGAYTSELIGSLNKKTKEHKNLRIEAVDFGKADLSKHDVLHFPHFHPYQKTLPDNFSDDQKIVVTIHDLIQLIYPKIYQPGFSGKLNFWKQKKQIKKVDAIIVPSVTSKKDAVRFLGVDPGKVHVVYEGVKKVYGKVVDGGSLKKINTKYKLPKKFVLYVGDVNYNKNIPTLIQACLKAKIDLVICGKQALEVSDAGINLMNLEGLRDYYRFLFNIPHPELKHYSELSDEFDKNKKTMHRLGFVPDEDLSVIFNLASVYVQPSFYEGFGLPVLEAFASQVPVVVSKTNCLVEVAGDAALHADPNSADDMSKKISDVIKNKRVKNKLIKKGSERLTEFSWKKAARQTLEIYEKVVSSM